MSWKFVSNIPIYLQIIEEIEKKIISGEYTPGSPLPSVRDLSIEADVNPNTMQRALSVLEEKALIYTQRTSGKIITEDQTLIKDMKLQLITTTIKSFLKNATELGYSYEETLDLLNKIIKEENL